MLKSFFLGEDNKANIFINAIIAFAATLIASVLNLHHGHEIMIDDFCQYIMQAGALLNGSIDDFIKANSYIISHSWMGMGMTVYPWGFPLMIAVVMKLGGGFMQWKMIGVLCLCLCAVFVYLLALKRSNRWIALLAALFVAFDYELVVTAANRILSDIPYCMLTLLGLYSMELMGRAETRKREYVYAAILGFSASYASETRSNGYLIMATFICAVGLAMLADRFKKFEWLKQVQWRVHAGSFLTAWGVYLAVVLSFRLLFPGNFGSFYMFQKFSVYNIVTISDINFWSIRNNLFLSVDENATYVIYAAFVLLFLCGCAYKFYQNFIMLFYCAGTFCLYMIWQYLDDNSARLLYSLALCMIPVAVSGLNWLREQKDINYKLAVVAASVVLFIAMLRVFGDGYKNVCVNQRECAVGAFTNDSLGLYDYIKQHTKESDVILFEKPRLLYWCTGRLCFLPQSFYGNLVEIPKADYLLTIQGFPCSMSFLNNFAYAEKFLEVNCHCRLQQCYANATYTMWKVIVESESPQVPK